MYNYDNFEDIAAKLDNVQLFAQRTERMIEADEMFGAETALEIAVLQLPSHNAWEYALMYELSLSHVAEPDPGPCNCSNPYCQV